MRRFILEILLLVLLGFCVLVRGAERGVCYEGRVVKIYDGDTLTVMDEAGGRHRVRLYAIDAPELSQAGGRESRRHLMALLPEACRVRVQVLAWDLYGREVGMVDCKGINLNRRQVAEGYAWHYRQYDAFFKEEFGALEGRARWEGLGIWWSPLPLPPWEYRKNRKGKVRIIPLRRRVSR